MVKKSKMFLNHRRERGKIGEATKAIFQSRCSEMITMDGRENAGWTFGIQTFCYRLCDNDSKTPMLRDVKESIPTTWTVGQWTQAFQSRTTTNWFTIGQSLVKFAGDLIFKALKIFKIHFRFIAGHSFGMLAGLKNDNEQATDLEPYIDFAVVEVW